MNRTLLAIIAAAGLVVLVAGCSHTPSKDEEIGNRLLRNAGPLMDRGMYLAARDSALRALEVFRAAGADEGIGGAEQMLGDIEAAQAGFDKALEYYASAVGHLRSAGDKIAGRAVTLSIMEISRRMGLEEDALTRGEEGLRLAQVSNDQEATREFEAALLPLTRTLDRRDLEDQIFADQQRLVDSTGDQQRLSWLDDQRGLSALARGNAAAAVARFTDARDAAERAGDTLAAIPVILHLSVAYSASGNPADAITACLAALPLAERVHAVPEVQQEILFRTGNALLTAKRNADAVRYFQSALAISKERGDELARRYALLQLANALRTTEPATAQPIVHQALEGLDAGAPPSLVAYAYGTEGLCFLAANQPVDALASFQHAVEATELAWAHDGADLYTDCRRTVEGTTETPWHEEEIDLLTRMGKNDDAFSVALRRSAWLLFRDLDRIRPAVSEASLQTMLDRWHTLRSRCNAAEEQLSVAWSSSAGAREAAAVIARVLVQTTNEAHALSSDIIAARRSVGVFVSSRAPSGQQVQHLLPDGTSLVLSVPCPRTFITFVAGRQSLTVHTTTLGRSQLAPRCTEFADQLRLLAVAADSLTEYKPKQISQTVTDRASALYEVFVRPIERELGSMHRVLIAGVDGIPFVPISALRRGGVPGTSLLERFPVSYVYPSLLSGGSGNDPIVNQVVAFGSSGTSGRDAEYELRDIKVTYKDAVFHFDPHANLADLAGMKADLAHLALDIHWDIDRPANSFVAMLDPASEVIKHRSLGELVDNPAFPSVVMYNLSVDADDAAGRIAVVPFAAGSKIVILNSAWTGRKSTKGFVDAFSTELRGAKGVGEAYRSALLTISRRPDALPVFWMPFVLWQNQ